MQATVRHERDGDRWLTLVKIGDQTVQLDGFLCSDRAVPMAAAMLGE